MGFGHVYHYPRGKADWIVRGPPSEPSAPWRERARALPYFVHNLRPGFRQSWIRISHRKSVADTIACDPPRLAHNQPLPDAFTATGPPLAVVLNDTEVLLGAIEKISAGATASEAMNPAPQTIRPDMTHRLAKSLLRHSPYLLITNADGRYLGRYQPPAGGDQAVRSRTNLAAPSSAS
jgi:hypothetical protein